MMDPDGRIQKAMAGRYTLLKDDMRDYGVGNDDEDGNMPTVPCRHITDAFPEIWTRGTHHNTKCIEGHHRDGRDR